MTASLLNPQVTGNALVRNSFRRFICAVVAIGLATLLFTLGCGKERNREARPDSTPEGTAATSLADYLSQYPSGDYGALMAPSGAPVVGAHLFASSRVPAPWGGWSLVRRDGEAISDENGEFRLVDPMEAKAIYWSWTAAGFTSARRRVDGKSSRRLVTSKGAVVTGRVVDSVTGEPISSGSVHVSSRASLHEPVTIAPDGTYRLEGIPLSFVVGAQVLVDGWVSPTTEFSVEEEAPERSVDLAVTLPESRRLYLRDDQGKELAEVDVTLGGFVLGRTDAEGGVSVRGLDEDESLARQRILEVQDFLPTRLAGELIGTDGVVTLRRGGVVSGRVVGRSGAPVAGAWVVAMPVEPAAPNFIRLATQTDELAAAAPHEGRWVVTAGRFTALDGQFRLTRLDPDAIYRVTWGRGGESVVEGTVEVESSVGSPPSQTLVIQNPPATIEGRVWLNGRAVVASVGWRSGDAEGRVTTEESGAFRVASIPSGDIAFDVRIDRPRIVRHETFVVPAKRTTTHDFVIVADPDAISGRVVTSDGTPLAATVRILDAAGREWSTTTAADGTFRQAGLEDRVGSYRIVAEGEGFRVSTFDVSAGSDGVELIRR